jgi:hypothetical protein
MAPSHFIKILLLMSAPAAGLSAASENELDEAGCRKAFGHLSRPPVLRAEFTQEKTLPEVTRTLRATGDLTVSRDHGVILRTISPEFTKGTKVLPAGSKPIGSNPVEIRINGMIRSVLAGDLEPLLAYFSAKGVREGHMYLLTLTPKSAEVKGAVTAIEVRFSEHLEDVLVREAGGGSLRLNFKGHRTEPPLTADELSLLTSSGR